MTVDVNRAQGETETRYRLDGSHGIGYTRGLGSRGWEDMREWEDGQVEMIMICERLIRASAAQALALQHHPATRHQLAP